MHIANMVVKIKLWVKIFINCFKDAGYINDKHKSVKELLKIDQPKKVSLILAEPSSARVKVHLKCGS